MQDFSPKIIGLTGSPEQIKQTASNFRIFYSKIENPSDPENYMVNHTGMMYLFDPQGSAKSFYGYEENYPEIIADIRERIGAPSSSQ